MSIVIVGGNDRMIPVSYTHLDVYKRQMHERVAKQGRILCRFFPAKHTLFIGYIGSDYFQ